MNAEKFYFSLIDFRGATSHFADPDFDGEPVQIYEPGQNDPIVPPDNVPPMDENGNPVPPQPEADEVIVDQPPDINISTDEDAPRKIYVDGVRATIVAERVEYLDENGKLITCAAPDNLLELSHGAHGAVKHDEMACLAVYARRKKPRGGDENGIFCFRVDEVPKLRLSLGVAPSDSHDVAVVLVAQVLILVNQSLPHPRSMLLIHAKDDGFLEGVSALLEKIGYFLGNKLSAVVNDDVAVEIFGVVDATSISLPSRSVSPLSGR